MTSTAPHEHDEARYWNEEGGERWVENIDRLETMLTDFSRHLHHAVNAKGDQHILDIGCGGGPTSAAYARALTGRGDVLGLDISAPILELAEQRFGKLDNLRFQRADAASHAFEANYFDIVTSRYGVMFFPEPDQAFANIATALKPDGRLALLVWRTIDDNPWMGAVARAAFTVLPRPEKQPPGSPGPFSLGDQSHTQALLEGAGFSGLNFEKIDETIVLGSLDEALHWLCRMGPAARPLAAATPDQRSAAIAAMTEELTTKLANGVVSYPGGAWLITATKA